MTTVRKQHVMRSFTVRLPPRPQSDRRDAARRVMLAIAAAAMASGAVDGWAQSCPSPLGLISDGGGDDTTGGDASLPTPPVPPTTDTGGDALPTPPIPPTGGGSDLPVPPIPPAANGAAAAMPVPPIPPATTAPASVASNDLPIPPVPPPAPFTVDDPPSPLYPAGTPYPAGVPYPSAVATPDNLGFYNGPDTSMDAEPMSDFSTPSVTTGSF